MGKKILIVGGGTASFSAAVNARKRDPEAEITIVSEEPYTTYSRCGIPYVVSGKVPSIEKLILYPPSYYETMKISFLTSTKAEEIMKKEKKLRVAGPKGESLLEYDSLIIAVGSKPFYPDVNGVEKKNVFPLWGLDDGRKINAAAKKAKSCVVVGGRMTGLEIAGSLIKRGLEVTVVDMLPSILHGRMDEDISSELQGKFEKQGMKFRLGKRLTGIFGGDTAEGVIIEDDKIDADMVVLAAGAVVDDSLAKTAGLEIGSTGLVKVDRWMRTSERDILAAGDCAEHVSFLTGKGTRAQTGTIAKRTGTIAGINAAGGKAVLSPAPVASVSKVMGVEFAMSGVTVEKAEKIGLPYVSHTVEGDARPEYYSKEKVLVKLIASQNGALIGSQIVGKNAGLRTDYCNLVISKGIKVPELSLEEFTYCPSTSDITNPISLCAESLYKKMESQHG